MLYAVYIVLLYLDGKSFTEPAKPFLTSIPRSFPRDSIRQIRLNNELQVP